MHFSYFTVSLLSFSIFIAGVASVARFTQIHKVYRPFIYLIWIGCVAEIMNMYFAYMYHNNLVVGAVYRLFECLFLLWFFTKLGIFKNQRKFFYLLLVVFILIWLADNFLSSHFNSTLTFYFDIVYALVIVLLSISAINDLLFTERTLLKNPTFLICVGLIIFFTYQIIQRMFGLYGLREGVEFRRGVQRIMIVINFLTNLIYAYAVLWMRKKRPFTFEF